MTFIDALWPDLSVYFSVTLFGPPYAIVEVTPVVIGAELDIISKCYGLLNPCILFRLSSSLPLAWFYPPLNRLLDVVDYFYGYD